MSRRPSWARARSRNRPSPEGGLEFRVNSYLYWLAGNIGHRLKFPGQDCRARRRRRRRFWFIAILLAPPRSPGDDVFSASLAPMKERDERGRDVALPGPFIRAEGSRSLSWRSSRSPESRRRITSGPSCARSHAVAANADRWRGSACARLFTGVVNDRYAARLTAAVRVGDSSRSLQRSWNSTGASPHRTGRERHRPRRSMSPRCSLSSLSARRTTASPAIRVIYRPGNLSIIIHVIRRVIAGTRHSKATPGRAGSCLLTAKATYYGAQESAEQDRRQGGVYVGRRCAAVEIRVSTSLKFVVQDDCSCCR